ncbi:hypothetical protein [Holophaga foetida]|uniref:hypothetical protein n=1 Tax=Holophaga foetida TaxID=35839 RepID=UPI00024752F6|nr:hypothetical protein [Holophaga foetida]
MHHPLQTSCKGPSRKIRGLRRYFSKLIKDAERFTLDPNPEDWWDFWHYHSDWFGLGNVSLRSRTEHLKALLIVLNRIFEVQHRFPTQLQAWLILNCQDASQDAVFLHTPNVNGTVFPVHYPEIEWGIPDLDSVLAKLAPNIQFQVGRASGVDASEEPPQYWSSFFIFRPDLGVPLNSPQPNQSFNPDPTATIC